MSHWMILARVTCRQEKIMGHNFLLVQAINLGKLWPPTNFLNFITFPNFHSNRSCQPPYLSDRFHRNTQDSSQNLKGFHSKVVRWAQELMVPHYPPSSATPFKQNSNQLVYLIVHNFSHILQVCSVNIFAVYILTGTWFTLFKIG